MLVGSTQSTVSVSRPLSNGHTLASFLFSCTLLDTAGHIKVVDPFSAAVRPVCALFAIHTWSHIHQNTHWDCVGASVFRATVGPNVETPNAEEELRHGALCVSGQQ